MLTLTENNGKHTKSHNRVILFFCSIYHSQANLCFTVTIYSFCNKGISDTLIDVITTDAVTPNIHS